MKARISSIEQEISILQARLESAHGEQEASLQDVLKEEQNVQEAILSLIDQISRYKQTVDVGIPFVPLMCRVKSKSSAHSPNRVYRNNHFCCHCAHCLFVS